MKMKHGTLIASSPDSPVLSCNLERLREGLGMRLVYCHVLRRALLVRRKVDVNVIVLRLVKAM